LRKETLASLFIATLILLSVLCINVGISAQPATKIYIYYPLTESNVSNATVGETLTVEVKIENVKELNAWQFWLKWDPNLLELVQISEGPFLNASGAAASFFVPKVMTADTIYVADALKGALRSQTASGNGTLATVTFKVKAEGVTALHFIQDYTQDPPFYISKLIDWDQKKIPHTTEDGYQSYPAPEVSVQKVSDSSLVAGKDVDISISVVNVKSLYNWSLGLRWMDTSLLDALTAYEGSFLKDKGTTRFGSADINQTSGRLHTNCTLTGEPLAGVDGNGTLTTITFRIEAKGFTNLELFDLKLFKRSGEFIPAIPKNGYFSNVIRDLAITSVEASKYSVKRGEPVNITVITKNEGEITEEYHVTVSYDGKDIGSSSIKNATSGGLKAATIEWDTWGASPGEYTIKAEVDILTGEADTADNTGTAPSKVTIIGGESGVPTVVLIGAVVAIGAVGGGASVFFLRRAKRKG